MYLKQTSKTILKIIYLMPRMQIRDAVEEWYCAYSEMAQTLRFFNDYIAYFGLEMHFLKFDEM